MSAPVPSAAPVAAPPAGGPQGGVPAAPVVVGSPRRRGFPWKPLGWTALVVVAIGLVVFVLAFTRPAGSDEPYSSGNPGDDGGRALAQVLADHGVEVTEVDRTQEAYDAASAGETLLVAPHPSSFGPGQIAALRQIEADIVLLAPDNRVLRALTGGRVEAWSNETAGQNGPQCAVPAALAAGNVRLGAGLDVVAGNVADRCWPAADGSGYAYMRLKERGRWVHVIHDAGLIRNDTVLDDGNAALALGTLGAHERLTWFLPDIFDTTMMGGPEGSGEGDGPGQREASAAAVLPEPMIPVAWLLLLTALVLAIWRGRRFGPLVTEPLPVLVRSAETMRGRARLYRAVRARGHAAAGLRASAAHRMAQRLGLARSSDASSVTDAVAAATDRTTAQVAYLLYGPPPADDGELTELARSLDTLESEVHRS